MLLLVMLARKQRFRHLPAQNYGRHLPYLRRAIDWQLLPAPRADLLMPQLKREMPLELLLPAAG
jgi:hypothetical protein